MNEQSRSRNSIKNLFFGIGGQILTLLLSFISRTIFINLLGADYLGVNGLYSNILIVLSLAELGIGNVLIYSLYKPIQENDKDSIKALLDYFKKMYRIIALVILVLGISIIPFLSIIIKSDLVYEDLILYYVLFLLNSVSSYFVVYKTILINADQKIYIIKIVQTIFTFIKEVGQITILLLTKSYVAYLLVLIATTILNNIVLSIKADKMYPFIKEKGVFVKKINIGDLNQIIKSAFLYKIGVVIMNNTDNIIISVLIGTVYVGFYSNYSLLIASVTIFINIVIQAIFSSIGNFNADGNRDKSYRMFNILLLIFHWISAVCSVCFLLVFNDFIQFWLGTGYLLEMKVVWAIVINFYIQNIVNPVWIYRETMGLYNEIKYVMLVASLINLVLSVILGLIWGLVGIFVATALSRIVTTVWFEPKLLYKQKFDQPVIEYWKRQSKYFLITLLNLILLVWVFNNMAGSFIVIMLKILISSLTITLSFIVLSHRSEEVKVMRGYVSIYSKRFHTKNK